MMTHPLPFFVSIGALTVLIGTSLGCPASSPGEADAASDKGSETITYNSCAPITVGSWSAESSDVSAAAVTSVVESVDGESYVLRFLFERYGEPGTDSGTFDLSVAPDNNFGTCAHCVVASNNAAEPTFFYVDQGSLELRRDPFGRRFDFTATDLRLVEVTLDPQTRESTPVPGGRCLTAATIELDDRFPPSNWSCTKSLFADGADCHCDCSARDPDCSGSLGKPAPAPVDCETGEVCTFDPVLSASSCKSGCDWGQRVACEFGTCVYSNGAKDDGDTCIDQATQLDLAAVGEACASGGNLQRYCGLEDKFATGYCDVYDMCRSICDSDDQTCSVSDHSCQLFLPGGASYGYCGPPPPVDG